ncbi:MAG: Holliday junction resolvase RuvX [Verrucomicrobia bacterium]|jgi:putative Holliday junction resolvase|nr:MAG: Holliday junction resolvase RuvX [Verrucomicrobiota bacterium]RPF91105.1 MAG: Holliday junction resolvase RuvX [Roseibacillus sp. TMED18]|tara:strand:+ start:29 stop:448 length:420 start_codon:yes stop_codon:yes gene_type:complete
MTPHPILAIDHGQSRIGIAATDELGIASHPVETIHISRTDPLKRIPEIAAQRNVSLIILGLPLRLDGSEGEAAQRVRNFGNALTEKIPNIRLEYSDERLTTTTASEKLREAGKDTRAQRDIVDQVAALEILNGWLDENE